MSEENISQEFRLKNKDETRNCLIEETNRNDLMSKKYKMFCKTLNCTKHFLILGSILAGCVSISDFVSLVGIPIVITSSVIGLKICAIAAAIKQYESVVKKKKKRHDKIVLLAICKLNSIEDLIFKALIDSVISHDEFVLISNVLKEYNETK